MTALARLLVAAVALVAAVVIAGCGGDGDTTTVTVGSTSTTSTDSGSTTGGQGDSQPVSVPAEDGSFDARAIYENASPGVVTVISVFDNASGGIFGGAGGGGSAGGQGSGFVISGDGEILTNAHVVTDAETTGTTGRPLHEASEIYVQFADRNQVQADVVGFDPFADVALLKVDPADLDLQHLDQLLEVLVATRVLVEAEPARGAHDVAAVEGSDPEPLERALHAIADRVEADLLDEDPEEVLVHQLSDLS